MYFIDLEKLKLFFEFLVHKHYKSFKPDLSLDHHSCLHQCHIRMKLESQINCSSEKYFHMGNTSGNVKLAG